MDENLEQDEILSQSIIGIADSVPTKKAVALLQQQVKVEARGMLVVTTFCKGDAHLLNKRIEWLTYLGVSPSNDLLLIGDRDLEEDAVQIIAAAHRPFFKSVTTRRIVDSPKSSNWPDNVNHAFRRTYRILRGQYAEKFNWNAYHGWFYFEPDVTPLTKDALPRLEAIYRSGFNRNPALNKPFAGFVSETTASNGKIVRHLNGAAVYPTKEPSSRHYNSRMLLEIGIPWDVAGLCEGVLGQSTQLSSNVFINAFGTWNYKKEGNDFIATQKLQDGKIFNKRYTISSQILHHGCKDGSLIDLLMGKNKESVIENKSVQFANLEIVSKLPEVQNSNPLRDVFSAPNGVAQIEAMARIVGNESLEEQIKADKSLGIPWKELMKKYKISPKNLKAILG